MPVLLAVAPATGSCRRSATPSGCDGCFPRREWVELKGLGHMPMSDDPESSPTRSHGSSPAPATARRSPPELHGPAPGRAGPPLVLIHGFTDMWRTWELALPALERRHEVLAPTLAGHAGGPESSTVPLTPTALDAVERAIDEAGFETAGDRRETRSAGTWRCSSRRGAGPGRWSRSRPAGGWVPDAPGRQGRDRPLHRTCRSCSRWLAPHADQLVWTPEGRRPGRGFLRRSLRSYPAEAARPSDQGRGYCRSCAAARARRRDG